MLVAIDYILCISKSLCPINVDILKIMFSLYLSYEECDGLICMSLSGIPTIDVNFKATGAKRHVPVMVEIFKRKPALKRKCFHFDGIFVICCIGSCHFDNFRCSQWWKFHQNDDISISVCNVFVFIPGMHWHTSQKNKREKILHDTKSNIICQIIRIWQYTS